MASDKDIEKSLKQIQKSADIFLDIFRQMKKVGEGMEEVGEEETKKTEEISSDKMAYIFDSFAKIVTKNISKMNETKNETKVETEAEAESDDKHKRPNLNKDLGIMFGMLGDIYKEITNLPDVEEVTENKTQ